MVGGRSMEQSVVEPGWRTGTGLQDESEPGLEGEVSVGGRCHAGFPLPSPGADKERL